MSHLVPCPSCARHVRVSEAACPFCASALPDALRASPAPRMPGSRLSRAATYALGVALSAGITATAACGGDGGGQAAMYGGPPTPPDTTNGGETNGGGGDTVVPDAGTDESDPVIHGTPVPAYGVPAPPPHDQPVAPAYGGPPKP